MPVNGSKVGVAGAAQSGLFGEHQPWCVQTARRTTSSSAGRDTMMLTSWPSGEGTEMVEPTGILSRVANSAPFVTFGWDCAAFWEAPPAQAARAVPPRAAPATAAPVVVSTVRRLCVRPVMFSPMPSSLRWSVVVRPGRKATSCSPCAGVVGAVSAGGVDATQGRLMFAGDYSPCWCGVIRGGGNQPHCRTWSDAAGHGIAITRSGRIHGCWWPRGTARSPNGLAGCGGSRRLADMGEGLLLICLRGRHRWVAGRALARARRPPPSRSGGVSRDRRAQ